jgi:outer membrane protein
VYSIAVPVKTSNRPKLRGSLCAISLFLASLVLVSGAHGAALTTPTRQQIAEFEASPESARVKLLILLAKSGKHDLASSLLQSYPLQGEHAANRTLFIEGLIRKADGDLTGATDKFRAALADQPKLTLVRQELAQTLVMLDENDSAKHHLTLLAADAPSEEAATGVRSFIDQIDEKTPFRFGAYVSFAPSTNVNSGSGHSTVYSPLFKMTGDIDPSMQAMSGIGFAVGGNAGYSRRLGNDFVTVLAAGLNAQLYDNDVFNNYSASQSAELRYLLDKGYVGIGGVASETLDIDAMDVGNFNYGPRLSIQYNLNAKNRVNASVMHEWRTRPFSESGDETAWIVDAGITHSVDSTMTFGASVGFTSVENGYETTSYDAISLGINAYKELPKGFTLSLYGQARKSDYDGITVVMLDTREDTRLIGSATITKRDFDIFGYAPSLEYTYMNNISNFTLYDYDSHAIDLKLTKDF